MNDFQILKNFILYAMHRNTVNIDDPQLLMYVEVDVRIVFGTLRYTAEQVEQAFNETLAAVE